ncbi:MAG: glucodextranase DOMON-like domain-containing protein, partial [Candidatus Poseidoniaceae archaeon]
EPYGGTIEPMIDGIALPGEWDGAARYDADSVTGSGLDIESFHVGYDSNNVYVRVDVEDDESVSDKAVEIYFMQPNAVNFNEAETNFRTAIGGEILGFPAKNLIRFDFDELRDDGRSKWTALSAKGVIGSSEVWASPVNSNLGGCAFDDVYEFQIPWSEVGLAPRYSTRIKVVVADLSSESDLEVAPPAPAEMVLPELEEWVTLLEMSDASGDGNGDGTITLPTASDFAGGMDLFDIRGVKIEQSDWNARFTFEMGEITNYWSLSNGFSHQIIQIYVDKGESETGRTDMLPGANAEIHPDWAWEVVISGTGEPGAVYSIQSETGATSSRGVDVEGDKDTNSIVFTVSKDVIGTDVASYRYVVVSGSQDGFGTGKWRDVDATSKTWTLGGGSDASTDDGIEYDPNVLDIVRTDDQQETILAGYDVSAGEFAQLTGFEMPEISQQIYAANMVTATDSTAIISWSTTKESTSEISCSADAGEAISESSDTLTISHQLEVTGLTAATNYTCVMTASGDITEEIMVMTSADVDTTAPQILNIRTTTDDTGLTVVSWFTDEDTFGKISLGNSDDETDFGKNHQVSYALCVGDHEGEITATDPSGNTATQSVSFTTEGDGKKCSDSGGSGKVSTDDEASMLSSTNVQIVALVVVLLVFLALIRTRRDDFE